MIKYTSLSAAIALGGIAAFAPLASADSIVTSTGTISEFSPDAMIIRSESSPDPIRYSVTKDVTYVDEAGAPVSVDVVRSGAPVSVDYVKEGDRMIVRKVIVRRTHAVTTAPVVTTAPAVTSSTSVTTAPAPAVVEQRTKTTHTTTTNKKDEDKD